MIDYLIALKVLIIHLLQDNNQILINNRYMYSNNHININKYLNTHNLHNQHNPINSNTNINNINNLIINTLLSHKIMDGVNDIFNYMN